MKNILKNKILLVLLGFFAIISCDEYLEEELRDAITPENFFNNDKEAELAVNGIYTLYHNNNLYRQRGLDDYNLSGADEVGPNRNVNGSIHNYLIAEGTADGNGVWSQLYEVVNGTTEFLANIDGNEKISEAARNQAVGELLFLRALAFFHLTNLWGDVPYFREMLNPIEAGELGRYDKDLIRTDMKEDLTRAISLLPESYSSADLGRATKWAAYALKAKFHLFDKEWALAKSDCDAIINNSHHTLLDNFADVFNQLDPTNSINNEHIFIIDFKADELNTTRTDDYNPRIRDEPSNRNENAFDEFGNPVLKSNGTQMKRWEYFQSLMLEQEEDMTGYGWAIPLPEIADRDNWQDGDLRYDATIVTEYLGFELAFPYYRKNWNLDQVNSVRYNHHENYIVFRLADIYLMAAEAENELNGPANAYPYVNKVRERAFDPDQPWSGMSQSEFREAMYSERKFELAAEGHRKMDLIRWGILLDVVKNTEHRSWNNPAANIQPYHVLLPVPQNQILLNANLLDSDPTNNGYR
ncbi:RagB/SusD family nutrient uptake outer membrane protein [Lutibacter sp. A64]|uniref:RagB/SusD family nutrient uptake outer membrane protein n=1 Tax=Lutibacter sp. A64 TaxID=2918526 RepID=UPI001F06871E|nr:RagB/SusD family nutrient uptake outer membrane protein [Lutibacter sp. A64]UMB53750.1 RagB/SusD family nutrient uptake outer membrane protein [Lutibacter sp. A64]